MLVMNVLLIGIVGKAGNEDDAGNIGKAEKTIVPWTFFFNCSFTPLTFVDKKKPLIQCIIIFHCQIRFKSITNIN